MWVMNTGGQSLGIPLSRSLYATVFIPVLCSFQLLNEAGIVKHSMLLTLGEAVGETDARHCDTCTPTERGLMHFSGVTGSVNAKCIAQYT